MPFIPNTDDDRNEMLNSIGVKSFKDLIFNIPENMLFKGELNLPEPLSEFEVSNLLKSIAQKNLGSDDFISFLGGGTYDHFIPAAIDEVISRPEFYTAYTPYQPEVSQGTLQAIYEYQSLIAELTQMDVANASMYDGGSAVAEAVLMALSATRKKKIIIAKTVNPFYRQIIETYLHGLNIEILYIDFNNGITSCVELKKIIDNQTAAVIIQHPNFFGALEDVEQLESIIHENKALYITSNDPMSLAILEPPGNYNVDIATGEAQCFGNAQNFGGPNLGIIATKDKYLRKIPGRLVGMTTDTQGRDGFVLTFQTREQHIRRDKATSNICTNQALNALIATVYLSLMGKQGLIDAATLCLNNSHYLADQIQEIDGYKLLFSTPFFKEFVISTPENSQNIISKLEQEKIFAGINLADFDFNIKNGLLIAVTEKRTKEQMDKFVSILKNK